MSSAIMFRCHACKARIKAPLRMLGQVRPCPRCKQTVRVRISPPDDAGPVMVGGKVEEDTAIVPALVDADADLTARNKASEGTKVLPALK
jgi:hypothetical protein